MQVKNNINQNLVKTDLKEEFCLLNFLLNFCIVFAVLHEK